MPTIRALYSEVLRRRPGGRGRARNERTSDYSRIPDDSDSYPHESHELTGGARAAVPASSAQPGPSDQSGPQEPDEAKNMRLQACKKIEKRAEWLKKAQEALQSGDTHLWKKFKRLAKKCWKEMVRLRKKAAELIFRANNKRVKPGEIDLHFLHVPEAIEKAEQSIQAAISNGDSTIHFITGKGKHSKDGPKILPALQEHIGETRRELEFKVDPKNEGVLIVHLPRQEPQGGSSLSVDPERNVVTRVD